ncbi:MAG: GIY-YIG nuclease family protein [Tatlockia sp.]|nr:GIY-YIG nuclease family protein [Tatlockia sp.]
MQYRLAFVDIETTGLHVTQDKITEIAVMIVTEKGIEKSWSSLINPLRTIPQAITSLTGLSNASVAEAPFFHTIAEELALLLKDCVLVAHNARFDYGFLKNAFKAVNHPFQLSVLCTIKLFRSLYPQLKKYNLTALASTFSLPMEKAHRARGDVQILYNLFCQALADFSTDTIFSLAKTICKTPSIPSSLKTAIHTLPDSPGVYLFYGAHSDLPLYIGKSIHLRQRVLSHFQADFTHAKEFAMAQQVERIEFVPTAGELSALLLESALIKEKMPVYNRRLRRKKMVVGFKVKEVNGYLHIFRVRDRVEDEVGSDLLGAFSSLTAAKRNLLSLCKMYELCPRCCGLESGKGACFSYQLKRCHGACLGEESADLYNARVTEALSQFREENWPFDGAIAIKEEDGTNQLSHYLVFNQWRQLGVAQDKNSISAVLKQAMPSSEFDTYKILLSFLKNKEPDLHLVALDEMY